MAEVEANGIRLHVVRLGQHHAGPPVVMMHGMVMDNLSSFYYTLANPVALEHEVVLYDLRGHGRSERPPSGYTLADGVADLAGLLDALAIDEPVVLVGNSFGGTVALDFTIAHPERVAGLVLIEAHFAVEGWGEHMAGSLALAAFGLDDADVKAWLEEQGGRKLNRMARNAEALIYDTTMLDDLQAVTPITEEALRAIGCPVLALYGEHTDLLDRARDLERLVPAVELHVLPEHTHSILMEGKDTLLARLLPWLAERRADRAEVA
jgi:pimeloyl-ACP methyl ester carboxylesterase